MPVVPEDRSATVPALDRAIEIVPLVDPSDRRRRRLLLVEARQRLSERHLSQQREGAVQDAAIGVRRHDEIRSGGRTNQLDVIGIGFEVAVEKQRGGGVPAVRSCAEEDRGFVREAGLETQGPSEQATDAADDLVAGASHRPVIAEHDNDRRHDSRY